VLYAEPAVRARITGIEPGIVRTVALGAWRLKGEVMRGVCSSQSVSQGLLAALMLAAVLWAGCEDSAPPADKETRAVMREIFGGIRVLLPASADRESFGDPAHRAEILAALELLSRNAVLLEEHAQTKDRQMRFLARSVSRDASDAQQSYADHRYERSAYVLRQIAENCVVCHTRLPDLEDSPVAAGFLDEGAMQTLPLEPRATLQIATRRFEEALDSLAALLIDPATHPAMMMGPLTDYLVVSIRVKGDFDGPEAMLREFGQRSDLWPSLRRDVGHWIESIPELRRKADQPSVASARAIIEEADANDEHGDGQSGLMHLVVASGILERFIDSHQDPDGNLGEAFYLLGTLEARIGRNYWVTPAPFLLEESIRLAPGGPFADDALGILESEIHAVYEGSDVEVLPADDAQRLHELRELIDRAT
jgi:hypothetical protein